MFVFILLCVCLIYCWKWLKGPKLIDPPLYPGSLPFIGHTHTFVMNKDPQKLSKLVYSLAEKCNENGGVMLCKLGWNNYYFITDPDDFATASQHVLKKHFAYGFLKSFLGDGLLSGSDLSTWKRHRKLLSPAFSQIVIDGFLNIFNTHSKLTVKELEAEVGNGPFHHAAYLDKMTLEAICGFRNKTNKLHENKELNGKRFKAFLDLALELSEKGFLTDEEVWGEMNTMIIAGYETTGNTLMYTLMLIGSHQNVQNKIYEELQSVFGGSLRDVEKQDLSKLVYLEAVIKESLRVYSITPAMLRHVDYDIQLKNYTIPAGSSCILFTCGLHSHPIWGDDATKFKPERWLDPVAIADPNAAIHKAFAGFGSGKRLCLGKTYAMISMKTFLSHLLRNYKISADITDLTLKMDPLLKPVSGDVISIERRALTQ